MIEQIQKFSLGGNSRQMLRDAEGTFRAAYANASEDAKRQADALIQSASNYSSANPTVGRQNRLNQAVVYEEATRILKGEGQTQAPSISGGWGNRVINDYYALNNKTKSTGSSEGRSSKRKYNTYIDLDTNWFGIAGDDEDLAARVSRLAYNIGNSLAAAVKAKEEGKVVRGLDKIADIGTLTNTMMGIAQQVESGAMDPRKAQAAILRYAPQLGITDKTAWDTYFGETDDLSTREKNLKKLKSDSYSDFKNQTGNVQFDKYLKDNNYQVAKDSSDNYYVFDKDWNLVSNKGTVFIDDDYTSSTYHQGYVVGADGRWQVSNDMQAFDQNSPYYQQVQDYINKLKEQNKEIGKQSAGKYNHYYYTSEHDVVNHFGYDLQGHRIADMSGYFNGLPVIAVSADNDIDAHRTAYGTVDLRDPALTYYAKIGNEYISGTYNEIVQKLGSDKINIRGDKNKYLGMNGWQEYEGNLDSLTTDMRFDFRDANINNNFYNWLTRDFREEITENKWEVSGHTNFDPDSDIAKAGGELAKQLIYLYATPESQLNEKAREFKSKWFRSYTKEALIVIRDSIRENPDLFEGPNKKKYMDALKSLFYAYRNFMGPSPSSEDVSVNTEKQGGVLKAQKGAIIDAFGNVINKNPDDPNKSIASEMRTQANKKSIEENALQSRAKENGRTAHQQALAEGKWTSKDSLRAAALATDVAGLIAAISGAATGGLGSIGAIGAGVVSTVMDTIADFSDESMSKRQAWKNLGINLGLTAGAAFGAKAPKILKSAVKLVPRIMMAAGTMGIVFDKEVHNTVKRMSEGKDLNIQDWRNIMMVLRMSTGIATAGTQARGVKKAKQKYATDVDAELKNTVKSQLDPNDVYVKNNADPEHPIKINKDVLKDVRQLLKDGKIDEAQTALKDRAGLSDDQIGSIISKTNKRGWKFWKSNEQSVIEDGATPGIRSLATPEELAAAEFAVLQKERNRYNKLRNKNWFTKTMSYWDQHSLTGKVLGLDPKNSNLMTAALAANNMSNKKGNFQQLISDKRAIVKAVDAEQAMLKTMDDNPLALQAEAKTVGNQLRNLGQNEQIAVDRNNKRVESLKALQDTEQTKLHALETEKNNLGDPHALREDFSRKNQELKGHQKIINDFETATKSNRSMRNLLVTRQEFLTDQAELARLSKDPTVKFNGWIEYDASTGIYSVSKKGMQSKRGGAPTNIKDLGARTSKNLKKLVQARKNPTFTEYETSVDNASALRKSLNDNWSRYKDLRTKTQEYDVQKTKTDRVSAILDKMTEHRDASINTKAKRMQAERLKAWSSSGRALTNTSTKVTIATAAGDITIPKNTPVTSFRHLRNSDLAETVAKQNKPNAQILKSEDISKFLPKRVAEQVRGALFDPNSGQITVWNKGGSIESKYQHLRK